LFPDAVRIQDSLDGDGTNSYVWDRANRLLSMGGVSYAYDGLNNRVSQTIGSTVTQYLLDLQPGLSVVLAVTTGANTDRYIHGPRGIHVQRDAADNWEWMVQDGLSSVRGVADSTGAVQWSGSYGPYGNDFGDVGTSQTMYGFTGEPTNETGLVHLRARDYNPTLGIFTALDPFEGTAQRPMSLNGYSWVEGNPVMNVDPRGKFVFNTRTTNLGYAEGLIEMDDTLYCIGRQAGLPEHLLEDFTRRVVELNGGLSYPAFRFYGNIHRCGNPVTDLPCLAPNYLLKIPDFIPGIPVDIGGVDCVTSLIAAGVIRNSAGFTCGEAPPLAPPVSVPPPPAPMVLTGGFRTVEINLSIPMPGLGSVIIDAQLEWRAVPYYGQSGWFVNFSVGCGLSGGLKSAVIIPHIAAGLELGLEVWPTEEGQITFFDSAGGSIPYWAVVNAQTDVTWDPVSGSFVFEIGVSTSGTLELPSVFLASGASVYVGNDIGEDVNNIQFSQEAIDGIIQALRTVIGFCAAA